MKPIARIHARYGLTMGWLSGLWQQTLIAAGSDVAGASVFQFNSLIRFGEVYFGILALL